MIDKEYPYQDETHTHMLKIPWGTIDHQSHRMGMRYHEPLIVAMDAMIRYAKATKKAYGSDVADDGVLGPAWLDTVKGIRDLLNGQGAVAMEFDRYTDSKSNGAVEGMFWDALKIAGFTDSDL